MKKELPIIPKCNAMSAISRSEVLVLLSKEICKEEVDFSPVEKKSPRLIAIELGKRLRRNGVILVSKEKDSFDGLDIAPFREALHPTRAATQEKVIDFILELYNLFEMGYFYEELPLNILRHYQHFGYQRRILPGFGPAAAAEGVELKSVEV